MNKPDLSSSTLPKVLCQFTDLGLIDYSKAYLIQQQKIQKVLAAQTCGLLLCEHPKVFTLGRTSQKSNFILSRQEIERKGIPVLDINRGGEITFHTPGQLVVYPIFYLPFWAKDLKLFMEKLEQTAIDLLKVFGIVANRIEGQRGIFVKDDKIGSIGIGVKQWVSFHGMSLNVNCDLKDFQMVRPCGLNVKMTSMRQVLKKNVDMNEVKNEMIHCFEKEFNLKFVSLRATEGSEAIF